MASAAGLMAGRSAISQWKAFPTEGIYSKVGGDLSALRRRRQARRARAEDPGGRAQAAAQAGREGAVDDQAVDAARGRRLARRRTVRRRLRPTARRWSSRATTSTPSTSTTRASSSQEEPDFIDGMSSLYSLDTDHAGCVSEVLQARGPIYTVGAACASGNVVAARGGGRDPPPRRAGGDGGRRGARVRAGRRARDGADGRDRVPDFNDEPARASRPYDAQREGFVPAHGGATLVLEELEAAARRGARIYAEVLGVRGEFGRQPPAAAVGRRPGAA